jgi:recombination protein RecR
MVNWVLKQDSFYIQKFAQNLGTIQEKIKPCSVCGVWTEGDPCAICSNVLRDSSIICVVEHSQDVSTIESHGEYKGLYQVLGGLIKPLEGIGPSQLAIPQLVNRIKSLNTKEVIIATNPTVEGDTTALYVKKIIQEQVGDQVKISRLATGIPVGGDLEYIDKRTLSLSFSGRIGM